MAHLIAERSRDYDPISQLEFAMQVFDPTRLSSADPIQCISIEQLRTWFAGDQQPRLWLPPIQRSLVWRNEQIVNYWDSLLRGYPAGTMMVHQAHEPAHGQGLDGKTTQIKHEDYLLFDGQQRLSAILLGFGQGPLSDFLQLWVDLGRRSEGDGSVLSLRISSEGQPFGYQAQKPNEKFPLDERRKTQNAWIKAHEGANPLAIFSDVRGHTPAEIIKADCAVPLKTVIMESAKGSDGFDSLCRIPGAERDVVRSAVDRIKVALSNQVIVQLIPEGILNQDEYARFFQRVGQGGTRLSDDELVYSLLKNTFPHIRDQAQSIVRLAGRYLSDVDLVLAALRIAKALYPWANAKDWEKMIRPIPSDVKKLEVAVTTRQAFLNLLCPSEGEGQISVALQGIKQVLVISDDNTLGLPKMLLARMPRDLLDTILLFAVVRGEKEPWVSEDRRTLIAFVLYWLVFVSDHSKAAYRCFEEAIQPGWVFCSGSLARLLCSIQDAGAARAIPTLEQWAFFGQEVSGRGSLLASHAERFNAVCKTEDYDVGHTLRFVSTNQERGKCILLYVQRFYIAKKYPGYDPATTRDDDLPFDLDHLIPRSFFGEDIRAVWNCVNHPDLNEEIKTRFREHRKTVGDSLGNLRWLDASANRTRQDALIEPECPDLPVCDDVKRDSWNDLIAKKAGWSQADMTQFQLLIDTRTLRLIKHYVEEGGISSLLEANATDRS